MIPRLTILVITFLIFSCNNNSESKQVISHKKMDDSDRNDLDSLVGIISKIEDTIPTSLIHRIIPDVISDTCLQESKFLFKGLYKFQQTNILCLLSDFENRGDIILISYDSIIRDVKSINIYNDGLVLPLHTVFVKEELEIIEIIEFIQADPKAMPHPDDINKGKKEIWELSKDGIFKLKK